MENSIKFPEDFLCKPHRVLPGATQWVYPANQDQDTVINIFGDGFGLYGDGITTFKMHDLRKNAPQGYLSADEINEYLRNNPIISEKKLDTGTVLDIIAMIESRILVLEEAKEYSEQAKGAYNEFVGLYDHLQMFIEDKVNNVENQSYEQ